MAEIEREDEEIEEVLNQVAESTREGTQRFPGMTYEEGVEAALLWVTGVSDEHPYPKE